MSLIRVGAQLCSRLDLQGKIWGTLLYRLMCDWVFPKQTSTPSYEDQLAKSKEREANNENDKEWGENVCMCIWQWFPPASLGANGEEMQTFITEQHAELTTLMAAPVSATSLFQTHLWKHITKWHQIATQTKVCLHLGLECCKPQYLRVTTKLSERSARLLSKWKLPAPFSVRKEILWLAVYSVISYHCLMG